MAKQTGKLDHYDEVFESVLSKENSEFPSNSEDKSRPTEKPKMGIKKRKNYLEKTNLSNKKAKKRKETAKDRLIEINNFYSKNSFGILIQCTKCNKWRKVMEYEEGHEVPEDWCCTMSMSGTNSCDEPENIDENVSPVNFVPGAIVWAKYSGYPWWPAMVEDDPNTEEYYWFEMNGKCSYNVTFLDDKVTRAWVPDHCVRPFFDPPRQRHLHSSRYSPFIAQAEMKAKRAMDMSIQERFQNFSFAHRYKGKWGAPLTIVDSDEDEKDLTQELLEEMNDIESTKSVDSDYRSTSSTEIKKNEADHETNFCEISSKDNSVYRTEYKKGEANENKLLVETKLKRKNKPTNEDGTVQIKEKAKKGKILNKLIDEAGIYLEAISNQAKTEENSERCVFQKGREVKQVQERKKKSMNLNLTKEKDRLNIETSISFKNASQNSLGTVNSNMNISRKASKLQSEKALKLNNLEEENNNAKENEQETKICLKKMNAENSEMMNPIVKENQKGKILNISSNSKFKPPVKNSACENNKSRIIKKGKEIAADGNLFDPDSIIKKVKHVTNEKSKENKEEKRQLDKTSTNTKNSTKKNVSKNTENIKGITENTKSENNLIENNIVKTLEKNLKGSLESKHISKQESINYICNNASNISSGTLIAKSSKKSMKQGRQAKNLKGDSANSEIQVGEENYNKRDKSTTSVMQHTKNDSLTEDLPISISENSNLTNRCKFIMAQNTSRKENKGKNMSANLKACMFQRKQKELKQEQVTENFCVADNGYDMMEQIPYKEDSKNRMFSLSLETNLQEPEEEDSDPFEAE